MTECEQMLTNGNKCAQMLMSTNKLISHFFDSNCQDIFSVKCIIVQMWLFGQYRLGQQKLDTKQ